MYKAAIDIGSNTILLLIVEGKTILKNLSTVTALGKNIDKTGLFNDESLKLSFETLKRYKEEIDQYNISADDVKITATEASRVVKNYCELDDYAKKLGFKIRLLSGEEEAFFTAKGITQFDSHFDANDILMFDIGGASTELALVRISPFEVKKSISLPIGAVRLNDTEDKQALLNKVFTSEALNSFKGVTEIVGAAGSVTNLAAMYLKLDQYEDDKVNQLTISIEDFQRFGKDVEDKSPEEILQDYPYLGKRAYSIHSGYLILEKILLELSCKQFVVTTRGLRFGTITMDEL